MTGNELMNKIFNTTKVAWDDSRIDMFKRFRAVYDNDYDEIVNVLKYYYLNKPYSEEYFNEMLIQHHNIIDKTLSRTTGGIYDKEPVRELIPKEEGEDLIEINDYFTQVLISLDYHNKIKEVFKASKFFNTVFMFVSFRNGEIFLDVVTPDMFSIREKSNDYLNFESILIEKCDEEGYIYYTYWDKNKHYVVDSFGNDKEIGNNTKRVNPYNFVPAEFIRMKDGIDFYGEPDWDLMLNQLAIDMKLTDYDKSEIFQRNSILFGVNTNLPSGTKISPNKIIQVENDNPQKPAISLEYVTPNNDFNVGRESINWRIESTLRNKGIVGSSAGTQSNPVSGESKEQDEISIMEEREAVKTKLWRFEISILNKIRSVWNYHVSNGNLNESIFLDEIKEIPSKHKIDIDFMEDEKHEGAEEKSIRRKYEKDNFIKDEVIFVMEDLSISEEEAINHIKEIQKRQKELSLRDPLLDTKADKQSVREPQAKYKSLTDKLLGEVTPDKGIS